MNRRGLVHAKKTVERALRLFMPGAPGPSELELRELVEMLKVAQIELHYAVQRLPPEPDEEE